MSSLLSFAERIDITLWLAVLTGAVFVISILVIIVLVFSITNRRWMKRLFGNSSKENLKDILQEHLERVGVVQIKLNDVENMLRDVQKASLTHVQKVGVVRFNPFDDTGSDQSFAIAILDAEDNGLVISALHSRERTRLYAKPIIRGQPGKYPFSGEEKKAISEAGRRKAC
ncbi:DUF4446 family protein [Patescibacteria group bacterium]|nr:DUF4446 family protein [Patescibacteria group bacterium]